MAFFSKRPAIAVLDITGPIDEARALAIMVTIRNTDWRKKNIRGLIVRICSNGGSLGAAQAICEAIETVREETGLITVSLVTETALSAAFYIAVACDMIFATPAATVGNVGAIVGRVSGWPLADKMGISFNPIRTGLGKGVLHPLAAPNPEGDQLMRELVDDIGGQFFAWVAQQTRADQNTLDLIRDGRMLSGKQAEALGLVSHCGGLYSAMAKISEHAGLGETSLIWLNPSSPSLITKIFKGLRALF